MGVLRVRRAARLASVPRVSRGGLQSGRRFRPGLLRNAPRTGIRARVRRSAHRASPGFAGEWRVPATTVLRAGHSPPTHSESAGPGSHGSGRRFRSEIPVNSVLNEGRHALAVAYPISKTAPPAARVSRCGVCTQGEPMKPVSGSTDAAKVRSGADRRGSKRRHAAARNVRRAGLPWAARRGGGTGRRGGLRSHSPKGRAGSSPVPGTSSASGRCLPVAAGRGLPQPL